MGKEPEPSLLILDSQSSKTSKQCVEKGFDGGKRVKGRKRQILVDTLGFLWGIDITPANVHDTEGGINAVCSLPLSMERLKKIVVDQGYAGDSFLELVRRLTGAEVEVVARLGDGFTVLPKRWIVERSFAWLEDYRRLTRDFECLVSNSISLITLAFSRLLLKRLSC